MMEQRRADVKTYFRQVHVHAQAQTVAAGYDQRPLQKVYNEIKNSAVNKQTNKQTNKLHYTHLTMSISINKLMIIMYK